MENPYRKQQAWIDRDFRITKLPANLNEGYFIQQPHIIPKDTEISIVVTGKSKIYVAFEYGSRRSGNFERSLPNAGWTRVLKDSDIQVDTVRLNQIFRLTVDEEEEVKLPKTKTTDTVMLIAVVSVCPGKSYTLKNYY